MESEKSEMLKPREKICAAFSFVQAWKTDLIQCQLKATFSRTLIQPCFMRENDGKKTLKKAIKGKIRGKKGIKKRHKRDKISHNFR